jgi:hypothetical protein
MTVIARSEATKQSRKQQSKSKAVLTLLLTLTENAGFSPAFIYERRVAPFV